MNNLKKTYLKYIGIGGCVIAIIGVFIPWISAIGYSAALIDRLGAWLISLLIATGILFLLNHALYTLIASILSAIWLAVDAGTLFGNKYIVLSPNAGLFVMIIGLIIAIISAILMLIISKKESINGQF